MLTKIHLFFELFYIRQFINLESLILIEITEQHLNKVTTKLNLLSKLSYLSIKLAHGLILKITVSSLKYLPIGIYNTFLSPTITTEIYQLKIELAENSNITFNDITVLFLWMPKLKKFTFIAAKKGLKFIRGEQWEYLIRKYLPQLKKIPF
ncbi:unnamed protein product [Rotaria sordida]|uniref:Uncharacterized protein n=1 Tax=Rotaria sordida TaxID=392033 RepID=A0A818V8J8_9BILA|nr:unnamed protein product [Rotaria sordida]CAF3705264.1 unnamed protein product [Rotaria sordida]